MASFAGLGDEPLRGKYSPGGVGAVRSRGLPAGIRVGHKVQAAFRSSYVLPRVDTVAVGTDNVAHLRELAEALAHEVDMNVVQEYRQLLKSRQLA